MTGVSSYGYAGEPEIRHFRIDVSTDLSIVGDEHNSLPEEYALLQNYPNPFNSRTEIQYQLPNAGEISIFKKF